MLHLAWRNLRHRLEKLTMGEEITLIEPGEAWSDLALADLRAFLVRGLGFALSNRSDVDDQILEDFVQDALLKILENLGSFRGESRFTTWAQKIAAC